MEYTAKKVQSEDEFRQMREIRRIVFIVEQEVEASIEWEFEEDGIYFLVFDGDLAVGTGRWRATNKGIKIERMAVLKAHRSKGAGSVLLKEILADIPKPNYIYLHAQEAAINYYLRAGFEKIGERFFEANIPHFKMTIDAK